MWPVRSEEARGFRFLVGFPLGILLFVSTVHAGSEFTYQGQLQFEGQPVDGTCSFEFSLWNAVSGGTQQGSTLNRSDVTVTDGLFTVQLDFGGAALGSGNRWLQTAVGCTGLSGLVPLSRQPLTAAPYAYLADTVIADAVGTSQIASDAVTTVKIADGTITATDVDTSSVQRRVTGFCAADMAMTYIDEDGTIGCTPTGVLHLPYTDSVGESGAVLSLSNSGSGAGIQGVSASNIGIWGRSGAGSGLAVLTPPGVYGDASASPGVQGTSNSAAGVLGHSVSNSGVGGISTSGDGVLGGSNSGSGVSGNSSSGPGVKGTSVTGRGVEGESFGGNGTGVYGKASPAGDGQNARGVYGESADGRGVSGFSQNSYGVYGSSEDSSTHIDDPFDVPRAGVTGVSSAGNGIGIRGMGDGSQAIAVLGTMSGGGNAVGGIAEGDSGIGVAGTATGASGKGVYGFGTRGVDGYSNQAGATVDGGVVGTSEANNGIGVRGVANTGTQAWAVNGESTNGWAGYFQGKVRVTGDLMVDGLLSKGGGSFKIDHPLDPENKYLSHSFVESPEMKNVYDGIVTLDVDGEALVELPDWFEALNRDFRYQLTCVGGFAPVYIAEEIDGNQFRIAGGDPGLKVSWQVTGIRHDAFAKAHPIIVAEEKPPEEQELYLHPVELGQPASLSVSKIKEAGR